MKKLFLLSIPLLISALLLTAFWNQKNDEKSAFVIPPLLTRNMGLGSSQEQAFIEKTYQELKAEIARQPQKFQAYIRLAHLFMQEARVTGEHGHYYQAALKMAKQVEEKSQSRDLRFQSYATQASIYLSLHQFRTALELAQEAQKLNPYNAQNYGALVDAHVELGAYDDAVKMADKMVSIRPDLRSYARVSYLREIYGEVSGSIEAMEMAVSAALAGTEEAAWCKLNLGKLYARYGKTERAEGTFKQILLERPNYPFALAEMGKLAASQANYALAEAYLEQAAEIIPEVSFYQELAAIALKTGDNEKAEKISREILEMLADDEAHGHQMTLAYAEVYHMLMDDQDEALTYALKAYDQRPMNIEVNSMLASIYLAKGQARKAKRHLNIARRTGSQDPAIIQLDREIANSL